VLSLTQEADAAATVFARAAKNEGLWARFAPRIGHLFDQAMHLVEGGRVVSGVGVQQAHRAIGVQAVELQGQFAPGLGVEVGAQAFTQNLQRLVEVADFVVDIALLDGQPTQRYALQQAFKQQHDDLVRAAAIGAAVEGYGGVGAGGTVGGWNHGGVPANKGCCIIIGQGGASVKALIAQDVTFRSHKKITWTFHGAFGVMT